MPDAMNTPLDLHKRLTDIAQKAVKQVKDNPRPNESVLPDVLPLPGTPDPPNYR